MPESPLIKKLGIKPGHRVLIMDAPDGYMQSLGDLPEGVDVQTSADGTFDLVQVFVRSRADVDQQAAVATQALKLGGLLWFCYPKISSKVKTDVTRDTGWDGLSSLGLRPVTQIAIDDTWSALRFRPASDVKPRNRA